MNYYTCSYVIDFLQYIHRQLAKKFDPVHEGGGSGEGESPIPMLAVLIPFPTRSVDLCTTLFTSSYVLNFQHNHLVNRRLSRFKMTMTVRIYTTRPDPGQPSLALRSAPVRYR